jgi:hypothetical protein
MSRADAREDSDKGRSEMASKTTWSRSRALRFAATTIAAALTLTLVAGILPTAVSADAATRSSVFTSKIAATTTSTKLAATTEQPLSTSFTARARTQTAIVPVVTRTTATRTTRTSSGTSAAPAAAPAGDELAQAQSILAGLIGQYPILAGTTVSIGDANGYQAVAYYKSGRIVISPTHTASLSRILNHEVWHVIDWRDNGRLDWGENLPPRNATSYYR